MGKTSIAWTNETWNPVAGCSHVSNGCRNCYAERLSLRYKYTLKPWTAQNAAENVVLHPERLDAPKHWRMPRRVFVNSMSDLFHELVPDDFIREVFWVMGVTPQHTYQILTKRPERMMKLMNEFDTGNVQPFDDSLANLPNVWLGVSCEDQKTADERIPLLLRTPAAVRFLSCEPLLGAINLRRHFVCPCGMYDLAYKAPETHTSKYCRQIPIINWVIAGGESGPNFRSMNPDWARSIRDQCVAADVAFFYKQGASYRPQADTLLDGVEWHQMPQ